MKHRAEAGRTVEAAATAGRTVEAVAAAGRESGAREWRAERETGS